MAGEGLIDFVSRALLELGFDDMDNGIIEDVSRAILDLGLLEDEER